MLLQRHQVLYGIDTRIEARGNQAREYAGDVGAMRVFVKQRVFALPNEQLQEPFSQVVVDGRPWRR
jgi:hypothetical protein